VGLDITVGRPRGICAMILHTINSSADSDRALSLAVDGLAIYLSFGLRLT